MESIENRILTIIKAHPEGIKAREISGLIPGTTRKDINHVLYGSLKNKCRYDAKNKWYLNDLSTSMPESDTEPTINSFKPLIDFANSKEIVHCPLCGAPMKLRTAQRGQNRGNEFWGCTRYPTCKGTRPVESQSNNKPSAKEENEGKSSSANVNRKSTIHRDCRNCLLHINDECDGVNEAKYCPAFESGR